MLELCGPSDSKLKQLQARVKAKIVARGNELRAQTDLNKAIAELQRATGNSLTANNVTVQVR